MGRGPDVTPAHDAASEAAGKVYAAFNGNPAVIREARELLGHSAELNPLTARELNQVLLNAGEGPMTNPSLVERRILSETRQASNPRKSAARSGPTMPPRHTSTTRPPIIITMLLQQS
jgi:hypothetical protein